MKKLLVIISLTILAVPVFALDTLEHCPTYTVELSRVLFGGLDYGNGFVAKYLVINAKSEGDAEEIVNNLRGGAATTGGFLKENPSLCIKNGRVYALNLSVTHEGSDINRNNQDLNNPDKVSYPLPISIRQDGESWAVFIKIAVTTDLNEMLWKWDKNGRKDPIQVGIYLPTWVESD